MSEGIWTKDLKGWRIYWFGARAVIGKPTARGLEPAYEIQPQMVPAPDGSPCVDYMVTPIMMLPGAGALHSLREPDAMVEIDSLSRVEAQALGASVERGRVIHEKLRAAASGIIHAAAMPPIVRGRG